LLNSDKIPSIFKDLSNKVYNLRIDNLYSWPSFREGKIDFVFERSLLFTVKYK